MHATSIRYKMERLMKIGRQKWWVRILKAAKRAEILVWTASNSSQ